MTSSLGGLKLAAARSIGRGRQAGGARLGTLGGSGRSGGVIGGLDGGVDGGLVGGGAGGSSSA